MKISLYRDQNRITLFDDPRKEWVNLIAPILIIPLILISVLMQIKIQEPQKNSIIYFLASIIGDGHILFTYFFLLKSENGASVFKNVFFKKKIRFFILLVFSIGLFTYFLFNFFKDSSIISIEYVLLLVWGQHAIGQIKGMSLLYNKKIFSIEPVNQLLYRRNEFIEKVLFSIMQITWLFYLSFVFMKIEYIKYLLIILWLVSALIVLNSMRLQQGRSYNKIIFLLRIFLFPLTAHFPISGFFIFFIHGLEYELYLQSYIKKNIFNISYLYFLVAFFVFPAFHYLSKIQFEPNIHVFFVAYAFIKALDYVHYYLDAVIFRFRDPLVRAAYETKTT